MPKAVTMSAGQHNMLRAMSKTSLCASPVNHHLTHLPRPAPPAEMVQDSLCAQRLFQVLKPGRQGFES